MRELRMRSSISALKQPPINLGTLVARNSWERLNRLSLSLWHGAKSVSTALVPLLNDAQAPH